jgi:hypothetical protein
MSGRAAPGADLTLASKNGPREQERTGDGHMTDQISEPVTESLDELGPVDWIVIEFPGSRFNGAIAPEIVQLADRGIIRVLDLLLIKKAEDGGL